MPGFLAPHFVHPTQPGLGRCLQWMCWLWMAPDPAPSQAPQTHVGTCLRSVAFPSRASNARRCIGGWAITSSQAVWFAETWNMQDIRPVWPCLVKPGQRYIACFETLAQLALLQATHSHIGGGHYSFSMPSGTDNLATEASLNKLFTTSWPLQLFVQLTAFWVHAHNVLLQPTHVPGRNNDWADNLSRGRLARFSHRPESRVRFSPPCAVSQRASSCVRLMRPGARNT